MKTGLLTLPVVLAAGLAMSSLAFAQAPAGSTGVCKDGSYTSQATKRGACKGHHGVKEWYASEAKSKEKEAGGMKSEEKAVSESKSHKKESKKEKAAEAAAASGSAGAATAAAPSAAPAHTSSMASSSMASTHKAPKGMRAEAAPGGGAGKVWVNTSSHTYHCSGDQWYGKTKEGEYMTEAEAKAKGDHASHGKACS